MESQVSHDFKVYPLFNYDKSLNQKDIVDADNDDEDYSLIHAIDIIKDFFKNEYYFTSTRS